MDGTSSCARSAPAKCPRKGMPRPAQLDSVIQYLQDEFEKADRNLKPDPARHGAPPEPRRVHQHHPRSAGRRFPRRAKLSHRRSRQRLRQHRRRPHHLARADGKVSGRRRQRIASRAIGADPLAEAAGGRSTPTRTRKSAASDFSTIEASDRVEFDGEYTIRFGLPGERARRRQAREARLLDGRQAAAHHAGRNQAFQAGLLQSVLRRADAPRICRKAITFSAPRFINDDFVEGPHATRTPTATRRTSSSTRSRSSAPIAPKTAKPSRKKILICDPQPGAACVEKIVTTLAHHAYRRPGDASRSGAL